MCVYVCVCVCVCVYICVLTWAEPRSPVMLSNHDGRSGPSMHTQLRVCVVWGGGSGGGGGGVGEEEE